MALLAECPECGHRFRLPEKFAGKRGKCPQCDRLFTAPELEEEIADWGDDVEDLLDISSLSEPVGETPRPAASRPGNRPKIPLPKRLAQVTPPPAPGAGDELPDLDSLSVPGGPPPAGPPVATPVAPADQFPDLSEISERPAAPAKRGAAPSRGGEALPDFSSLAPPAETTGNIPQPPAASAGGPTIDLGGKTKQKRRSSDVFDPTDLASQVQQVGDAEAVATPPVESRPSQRRPQPAPAQPASRRSGAAEAGVTKTPTAPAAPATQPTKTSASPVPAKPVAKVAGKPLPKGAAAAAKAKAATAEAKSTPVDAPAATTPSPASEGKKTVPKGAAPAIATTATTAAMAGDGGERSPAARSRTKPSKKPMMLIVAGGSLAALLLCIVGGWAINSFMGNGDDDPLASVGDDAKPPEEMIDRDEEGSQPTRPAAAAVEMSAPKWDEVRRSVVKVRVVTEDHRVESGTGFLIEPLGWVATAYSVIHRGTSATVVTYEGSYIVEGTVAVDPEVDLAILKIEAPADGVDLPALPLREDLERVEKQSAYVFREFSYSRLSDSQGTVEQSFPNDRLRPALRPHVPERARDNGLLNWIEVTRQVTGTAHGGPLTDVEGRVMGVSAYLGDSSSYGYAIHVKHLLALKASAGDQVTPLQPDPLARSDRPDRPDSVGDPDEADPPDADESGASSENSTDTDDQIAGEDGEADTDSVAGESDPYATPGDEEASPPETDVAAEPEPPMVDPFTEPTEITGPGLDEALAACEELGFCPITEEDYAKFQNLAFLLSEAQRMADEDGQPAQRREEWKQAAERVTNRLANFLWADESSVNELAVKALTNPHRGTFFYGTVVGNKPDIAAWGGRAGVFFKVLGTETFVVMPTKLDPNEFPKDSRWLVVGIHNPNPTMSFTINSEFGEHKAVQVDAMYVVGQPK